MFITFFPLPSLVITLPLGNLSIHFHLQRFLRKRCQNADAGCFQTLWICFVFLVQQDNTCIKIHILMVFWRLLEIKLYITLTVTLWLSFLYQTKMVYLGFFLFHEVYLICNDTGLVTAENNVDSHQNHDDCVQGPNQPVSTNYTSCFKSCDIKSEQMFPAWILSDRTKTKQHEFIN